MDNLYEMFYPNYPYVNGNTAYLYMGGQGLYNQNEYICQQYYNSSIHDWTMSCDPTTTVSASRDAMVNVMSYWRRENGTSKFTAGQKQRMDAVINQNPELINR